MSYIKYRYFLLIGCLLITACITNNDNGDVASSYRAKLIDTNDTTVNGLSINGLSINGLSINGLSINGLSINGLSINGLSINGLSINGSSLEGIRVDGKKMSGKDFIGAEINITVTEDGKAVPYILRIDNVYLDTENKFGDVWLHQISYRRSTEKTRKSLCYDYNGRPTPLIPMQGFYWDEVTGNRIADPNVMYLACLDGAVGKCTHYGYRPWATYEACKGWGPLRTCSDVALKDYHQACTRMIRADYCGDGIPHTINGTILDIYDYLDPNILHREERWQMEARWIPEGATCLTERRHPEIKFSGECIRNGQKITLRKCGFNLIDANRGLVVSTFDDEDPYWGKSR